jgi:hypothetical protein
MLLGLSTLFRRQLKILGLKTTLKGLQVWAIQILNNLDYSALHPHMLSSLSLVFFANSSPHSLLITRVAYCYHRA